MREDAVSEVVGTILLLALVVSAAAVFAVVLAGAVSEQDDTYPLVSFQESASNTVLYHAGGDVLTKAEIRIFAKSVDITDLTSIRGEPWSVWQTGEALSLAGYSVSEITIVGLSSSGREVLLYEGLKKG